MGLPSSWSSGLLEPALIGLVAELKAEVPVDVGDQRGHGVGHRAHAQLAATQHVYAIFVVVQLPAQALVCGRARAATASPVLRGWPR